MANIHTKVDFLKTTAEFRTDTHTVLLKGTW